MSLPSISIITPSYNQGNFLEETIRSVLDQNYPDLEYIIIDGGSTDQSADIIRKYESRLTYWVSEKDSGQSEAINKGLRKASGEILSWLCSDDLYVHGALHQAANLFKLNPDAVLIHGHTQLFDENGKIQEKGADPHDLHLRYFSVIPYPQPSSFFRRQLIDQQGLLREDLHFAMDYDLLIRAALHYPVAGVTDVLSRYRIHSQSKTGSQMHAFSKEWIRVFSKFLRSVPAGKPYFTLLEGCGLYNPETDTYRHQRIFEDVDVKKIVLYYLEFMGHLHYQLSEKKKTRLILAALRSADPVFYRKRNMHTIGFRARYLPSPLIRLMRKITSR